jgi:MerR family transcriptional regulator, redox-sensitive transcriptional activator SoxR
MARVRRELAIGEVAARTGLAVSAIRFYETQGLVHPIRNAGDQRRFHPADIRRLSFVLIAQGLGFSIAEIRSTLASLPGDRAPTQRDWSRIGRSFKQELDRRIEGLTRLRDKLDGCIGCGCLSLDNCSLYNAEDRIARNGAGPRYLIGDAPEPRS